MSWFKSDPERAEAKDDLRTQREDLERISRRDRSETDDYVRANRRVIDAEDRVKGTRRR